MAGGDADRAQGEAFGEAGLLDEPGGGELDNRRRGWASVGPVLGHRKRPGRWRSKTAAGTTGFLKKEPALRCRVGDVGVDDHALAVADGADGVVDVEGAWGWCRGEGLQLGVGEVRPAAGSKAKSTRVMM